MVTKEQRQVLMEEARRELARRTMGDFVLYVDDNYRMNWHHRLLCDYLDKLACKEIRRLMFLLAFYVLRENFGGFFGKLGPLFGKLVREPTSPMTPNDTDILTQRNSEN